MPQASSGVTLFGCRVPAGFPSPAEDLVEGCIDLNSYLIRRPASTFLARVSGNSMDGAGIHDGDLAIVDRSIAPHDGAVVVAVLNGELTLKRLTRQQGNMVLTAENPAYPPLVIGPESDLVIWGVVLSTIHMVNHHVR